MKPHLVVAMRPGLREYQLDAALAALNGDFDAVVLDAAGEQKPQRAIHRTANDQLNFVTCSAVSGVLRQVFYRLLRFPDVTVVSDRYVLFVFAIALNFFIRRRLNLIFVVPTGLSSKTNRYCRWLSGFNVGFLTSAEKVRSGLISAGVSRDQITVVEPFHDPLMARVKRREPFRSHGVRSVAVVGSPIEIEQFCQFIQHLTLTDVVEFSFFEDRSPFSGEGSQGSAEMWDLVVFLAPWENADRRLLDAFAARVPVLLASEKDKPSVLSDGVNGFIFEAGNNEDLALKLTMLARSSPDRLNTVAKGAEYLLKIRFSAEKGIERYRRLFRREPTLPADLADGRLIL